MTKSELMMLEFAEAQWRLGLLRPETLPDLACAALQAGFYSESLCVLAGLVRPTMRDAGPLLADALTELGRPRMTREQRLQFLAAHWARAIVDGAIRPIQGADQLALFYPCEELPEAVEFRHLADQWEWIQRRPELEREIIETARRLLTRLEG